MKPELAMAGRRALAFMVDWLVVAAWGGAIFGTVMIATGGHPPRPANPWLGQGIGLLTMTLPVALYFAFCEASRMRASLGKRLVRLAVVAESGGTLPFGSALLRNAVKFVPWELGHMVAQQAAFSGDAGFPAWLWGPAIVALAAPVVWVLTMVMTGRTPYDRLASARVAVDEPPALPSRGAGARQLR